MRFSNIFYFSKEALVGIWRNGWMTLASVTVVLLMLLVFGAFIIINFNLQHITTEIRQQVEIIVEISDELDETATEELRQQILGLEGVQQLTYVDKETALERMREQLGDVIDALEGRNPLLNSFEVQVTDAEHIQRIAGDIARLEGVETVNYGEELVETMLAVTGIIQMFGYSIIAVLAFVGLFLIANTIKLTVYARRRQINIMKFVGATDWFIRWPFILEGVFLGLLSATLAFAGLYFGYNHLFQQASLFMYQHLLALSLMEPKDVFVQLAQALAAFGGGIGALGSAISVRRFLRV